MQPRVLILASLETRGDEAEYLVSRIEAYGHSCEIIDTGLNSGGVQLDGVGKVAAMTRCAHSTRKLIEAKIAMGANVVAGIGGGTGAQIISAAMIGLPFAMPKVLINTMASDPRPDTADTSVIIIPSVSDLSGLNPTLRQVFQNAAAVISGLAALKTVHPHISSAPTIGLTALGTTAWGVEQVKRLLAEQDLESTAFHSNGYGGKAFARWCDCGAFTGVIDYTTHEVTRLLFDPECTVPDNRFTVAGTNNLPQIVLPGSINFLSRGSLASLKPEELSRPHYSHSPNFTHCQLTPDEMAQSGDFLGKNLKQALSPIAMIMPMGGFSSEDRPGGAIENIVGREAFLSGLKNAINNAFPIAILKSHINEAETAKVAVKAMLDILPKQVGHNSQSLHSDPLI